MEGRVRLLFWSTGTAALFRHHQSPRCVGRWKERRGSWDCEEGAGGASPALVCLHQHQTGHCPCPPSSCHLKHLRWLAPLESCKGVGRAGFCSLLPPSFADSLVIETWKKFPRLTLGQAVQKRSSLWRQFLFC